MYMNGVYMNGVYMNGLPFEQIVRRCSKSVGILFFNLRQGGTFLSNATTWSIADQDLQSISQATWLKST